MDTVLDKPTIKKPKSLSLFELMRYGTPNFLEFLLKASPKLATKYGEIVQLSKNQYLVTGPQAFKYILKTKPQNFTKHNRTYKRIQELFGEGLIVTDGPLWEKHRKPLHEFFHRERMDNFANIMIQNTQRLLEQWEKNARKKQKNGTVNIVQEMTILTLKIAFEAFASHQATPKELKTINNGILQGTPHISHSLFLSPWLPTPKNLQFFWLMQKISGILKNIIQKRKIINEKYEKLEDGDSKAIYPNDYLALLLSLQNRKEDPFNDMEVLDELKTILFTGHETTACMLSWAWYLLDKNPHYQFILEEELDSVLNNRLPTLEDCHRLPKLKAIVLETLRMYPAIWCLPRVVSGESEMIEGYTIPAGSQLILNVHALHHHPKYWEQPEEFYPPRFLGESDGTRHPYAFLPFSLGPHTCIGTQFAIMEGMLLIAMIAQKFRIKARYNRKEVEPIPYLSLRPPKKLTVELIPR